jgi:hypothetical protein
MPVYLKQWRDGDFTLVYATDLEDALRILDIEACVEPHTVLRLDAGDLHIHFTLQGDGELVCRQLTPAVEQARSHCFPELISVLVNDEPQTISNPQRKAMVEKAVDDEMTVRKESKLDTRLKARQKRVAKALGKR